MKEFNLHINVKKAKSMNLQEKQLYGLRNP